MITDQNKTIELSDLIESNPIHLHEHAPKFDNSLPKYSKQKKFTVSVVPSDYMHLKHNERRNFFNPKPAHNIPFHTKVIELTEE